MSANWNRPYRIMGLLLGIFLVVVFFAANVSYGATGIKISLVIGSFIDYDGSREHIIVQTIRFPRALVAMMVGCCLAV
jgi:iron complex transport system permease protein